VIGHNWEKEVERLGLRVRRPIAAADLDEELDQLATPSERLTWILRRENLTELAGLIGKDRTTLANYRLGRREPDLVTLAAICRVTGASADWILGLADEPWR
jgi:hypothetical protein